DWGFTPSGRAALTAFSMIGAIGGGILFGLASDRFGRRAAMVAAFTGGLLVLPLWAFSPTLAFLVAGAFAMPLMVQGAWGVIPAHIAELSPDAVRGFLPGFAFQCGVLLASLVVYLEALFAARMSYAVSMAITAGTVLVLAIVVTRLGPERKGVTF